MTMKKNGNSLVIREYDFKRGIRGKYAGRYEKGTNLVRLDPDVSKAFPNAHEVNSVLRAISGALKTATKVHAG